MVGCASARLEGAVQLSLEQTGARCIGVEMGDEILLSFSGAQKTISEVCGLLFGVLSFLLTNLK